MAKQRTIKRGTGDIAAAMRKRYPSEAYALLFEVGNSTGFQCTRHADALCMSLWPSRGLTVAGFEFKASRTDWVKERDNPAKSEAVLQYCDEWWLVVAEESIVKEGELPDTWGFMSLDGKGAIRVIKQAPKLTSKDWPKSFLAAVLRAAANPVAAIEEVALRKARWDGEEAERNRSKETESRLKAAYDELNRAVHLFEAHTGFSIHNRYNGLTHNEAAVALKSLADNSFAEHLNDIERAQVSLERLVAEFKFEAESIRKLSSAEVVNVKPEIAAVESDSENPWE